MYKQFVSVLTAVLKLLCWAVVKMMTQCKEQAAAPIPANSKINLLHCKRNHKEEETK